MANDDNHTGPPPPADLINKIELVSIQDSKITNVSLYQGRAEVTRLFKFEVKTGQNQVYVKGLPNVLDWQSLRVEGRGAATIQDVTISHINNSPPSSTSPRLTELTRKEQRLRKAFERCKKAQAALETYLKTLSAETIPAADVENVMQKYEEAGEKLDDQYTQLQDDILAVQSEVASERAQLRHTSEDHSLMTASTIGVFADHASEVELGLTYALNGPSWSAGYDVRVDMRGKDTPVSLVYKATIIQNTGESWDDVPLTLETATPSYGLGLASLSPWKLSVYAPPPPQPWAAMAARGAPAQRRRKRQDLTSNLIVSQSAEELCDYEDEMGFGLSEEPAHVRQTVVSSKGNVSATFRIPGLVTIPSDGDSHNFTIVQLELAATMSWVVVPKVDIKVHLKASIKNASDYTFIAGPASIYVDGSFISRSNVPSVSPLESFDCPLGLDPSIRVTYHPVSKKTSQTGTFGFYASKTAKHLYTQRVTLHNTKTTPVERLKLIDRIPVSEDAQIEVKILQPPGLATLGSDTSNGNASSVRGQPSSTSSQPSGDAKAVTPYLKVAQGVSLHWHGADEPGVDVDSLGKDGRIDWICDIAPQGKVNLTLQWEVSVPFKAQIVGLDGSS